MIDPTSLSFGELREVLSDMEAAARKVGGLSPAFRKTIADPFVAAAKERGIDVAEFPRLTGRQPIADIRDMHSTVPSTELSKRKRAGGHPFQRGSGGKSSEPAE